MATIRHLADSRVLASPNRFKLALFGINAQGGSTITTAPGTVDTDWDLQVRIAQLADAVGIEAILPGARWKGYGGPQNFQGRSYETLTWAAGIAAVTKRAQIFATVHFTTVHPIRLAKMVATIDHIAKGRAGINWVAGWNANEAAMFGYDQREHDDRYAFADDYLALLDKVFASTQEFDYKTEHFDLSGIASDPKPIQTPRPVYMGAGLSPRGRAFAATQCDINFTATNAGPDGIRAVVAETKAIAQGRGRTVRVFGQASIFCADSEAEARDYFDYVVNEKGDYEAAGNLMKMLFAETRDASGAQRGPMPDAVRQTILKKMVAAHGGSVLIGTPTQVVEQMAELADAGLDGTTVSWVDYEAGLHQFRDKILPLMIDAGLRVDEPTQTQG